MLPGMSFSYLWNCAGNPTFTANWQGHINHLGDYGPYPSTGAAAQTRDLLYNGSGYYFVQQVKPPMTW